MTLTTLPQKPSHTSRSRAVRAAYPLTRAARLAAHEVRDSEAAHGALARYTDPGGRVREILTRPGHAGSVLVVDRDATTLADRRLVAHLAADEPAENASLVCRHYLLRDARSRRCRPVTPEDLLTAPLSAGCEQEDSALGLIPPQETVELLDRNGHPHRLEALDAGMSIPELRWCRYPPHGDSGGPSEIDRSGETLASDRSGGTLASDRSGGTLASGEHPPFGQHPPFDQHPRFGQRPESVRDAVACLESYEPIRTITARALARYRQDPAISVSVLRAELLRIDASRIVLNRGLRRAVLEAMRTQGLSLSEIAFRCGRVKRDSNGNVSGETSWLSRRVGISPEGRGGEPTPWIHSEVLALIARSGLGISPREVEL